MKLTNLYLAIAAFVLSSSAMAANNTSSTQLPNNVVAEVKIAGGFMAPGMFNTTTYDINTNGDITKTFYHAGDFGAGTTVTSVVGHVTEAQLRDLQEEIAHISAGALVDVDPNGPMGADFPTVSYLVNTGKATILIASRGGDAHLRMLQQESAKTIKNFLDSVLVDSDNQ